MSKTVLFQTIQFYISTQFSSTWPIDRTLSGATTPSQSGPGSDGNGRVLCIPQSSSITGTLPSDCLITYLGPSLMESYPSGEKESVYFTAPADWAILCWIYSSLNYAQWTTLQLLFARLRIHWLYPLQRGKATPQKRGILVKSQNCIWYWGSRSGEYGVPLYLFEIDLHWIEMRKTILLCANKWLLLNRFNVEDSWNYITVCILFYCELLFEAIIVYYYYY